MKIVNEKGLLNLAMSEYPTDKEGYLYKKWEISKSFQKRWFVLKGNLLFYYGKKGEKEPLGLIILEGFTIEMVDDMENFVFAINFAGTNSRSYCLGAPSQDVMESWMKVLSGVGYEFMKLKVLELESRLSDGGKSGGCGVAKEGPQAPPRHARYNVNNSSVKPNNANMGTSENTSETISSSVKSIGNESISDSDRADINFPVYTIPRVEIKTWSTIGVHSFEEMHDFLQRQIIENPSD